jgi:hypothetical protein
MTPEDATIVGSEWSPVLTGQSAPLAVDLPEEETMPSATPSSTSRGHHAVVPERPIRRRHRRSWIRVGGSEEERRCPAGAGQALPSCALWRRRREGGWVEERAGQTAPRVPPSPAHREPVYFLPMQNNTSVLIMP